MKVDWDQFAQRRKINLDMFKSLTYEEYKLWCNQRGVEGVSKESYEAVKSFVEIEETPVETTKLHFDEGQLKKKRKSALESLCLENNVDVESSDTKKILIQKLLELNNEAK